MNQNLQLSNLQLNGTKPLSNLWLLVQCERPPNHGGQPYFEVIESSAVVQPKSEQMTTGKTIEVLMGTTYVRATIFIISDDRAFLENELRQQTAIANKRHHKTAAGSSSGAGSFSKHSNQNSQLNELINDGYTAIKNDRIARKKRRLSTAMTTTTATTAERLRSPSPLAWSSSNGGDHSNHKNNGNTMTYNIPPMTFDQQTQTDSKMLQDTNNSMNNGISVHHISSILANQEHILAEIQSIKAENRRTKEQLNNVSIEKMSMQTMLTELLQRFDRNKDSILTAIDSVCDKVTNQQQKQISNDYAAKPNETSMVVYTCSSVEKDHNAVSNESLAADQLIDLSVGNNVTIEQFDASTMMDNSSSNMSSTQLHNLTHNSDISNCSMYTITSSADMTILNDSAKRNGRIAEPKFGSVAEMVKHDWGSDGIDNYGSNDIIIIGNNGTKVSRAILDQIKWSSHTNATRKLLSTLFSREVLASHSLTGKPSPGKIDNLFHN